MPSQATKPALPALPQPQLKHTDFAEPSLSLFNNTISSIVGRINALSPVHPKIALKTQFLAQFQKDDLSDSELAFLNTQFTSIVNNTNKLTRADGVSVQPVQLVQLKGSDFEEDGLPVVNQFLTNIITRLNAM